MRMLSLGLLLLAATPALADDRPGLAFMGVRAGQGFGEREVATIEELVLNALQADGRFRVVGRSDLGAIIGLERQRQLTGCEGDSTCAAEIAGALGVPWLGVADIGRVGGVTALTLKIIDVRTATARVRAQRTFTEDKGLLPAVRSAATEALDAVAGKPRVARLAGWIAVGVGVAAVATAAIIAAGAAADAEDLRTNPRPGSEAATLAGTINDRNRLSLGLGIAGGVCAVAGVGVVLVW